MKNWFDCNDCKHFGIVTMSTPFPFQQLDAIIRENHASLSVEYVPGHTKTAGRHSNIMKNPLWKIKMENGSVISLDNDSVVQLNCFGAGKKTSAPTASQHPSAPQKFGPGQWIAGAGSAVELVLINQRQHGIDHRRCIIGSVKRYAHKLSLSRARRRL